MKGLAITNKGIEKEAALEIKELIKCKTSIKESVVLFEFSKYEDLFTLCYKGQSFAKVIFLFDFFEFNGKKSLIENINKIKISEWADKKGTFRVSCKRVGSHDFSSQEIEDEIGKLIDLKCDLINPDVIFYVYIYNNMCYLGIDFSGFDLSKRDYRIFAMPSSLKATIAYALTRISGYKDGVLLDPFCGSGEIPIEAAMFKSNFPVNYYNKQKFAFLKLKKNKKFNFDKFFKAIDSKIKKDKTKINCFDYQQRNVKTAEKNSKIAGVHKLLNFSRQDTEFLELKFKKNVDVIVTQPPAISKYSNKKDIEKIYNEFFYQAEYILKKNGKIVLISEHPEELKKYAEKYKFKIVDERSVFSGKKEFKVLVINK